MSLYLALKTIHILGSTLIFGTAAVLALFALMVFRPGL